VTNLLMRFNRKVSG